MRGFATAGGWTHLKYIIKTTETPTDKPNVINETPINSLKIIPVTIQTKCPKNNSRSSPGVPSNLVNTFPLWYKINNDSLAKSSDEITISEPFQRVIGILIF